ncbi:MAG: FAD-dependent oxidoreductase [Fervidicoccaceae archaeon]
MRIVVIGGGAAGASAASRAKKLNPEAEVILVERTDMITHGPCGIPFYIEGLVKTKDDLITYSPEEFEKERGIRVLINTEATEVNPNEKTITLKKINDGKEEKISWDKLVIATGALPSIPKIPGTDLEGVITIRHPADADRIKERIQKAEKVVIIGGGYIGIELSEAISFLGKSVTLIEMTEQLLPGSIDPDISKVIEEEIIKKGIILKKKTNTIAIEGKGKVERVVTDMEEIKAEVVIMATGVRPDTTLAKLAGVKIGNTGAIETNEYMETNVDGIYAAGDVVEKYHKIKREKVWISLAPSANKEGQVAGANASLGRVIKFPGIVGTSITRFFEMYIGRTGVTESEAKKYGFSPMSKIVKVRTSAHYYPKGGLVYVKIIADESTKKIIGAQIVGYDDSVAGYTDIASLAIEKGMSIEELYFSDLGYMPAVSPVWHPLIVAARVLSGGRL